MTRPLPAAPLALPVLALMFNAFVWGVSWWPFRTLQDLGLHPLWSTVLIYLVAVLGIAAWRPRALREALSVPALWVLVLASGTTNAAFNWAVSIGDVVRVVLLFYLMPLWAVVLARLLLGERLTPLSVARVALALGGAAIVLRPEGQGLPLPQGLADWLGLLGGFAFALNNVMLRREGHRPQEQRALAMFVGGALVAGLVASLLVGAGRASWPPLPQAAWLLPALLLAVAFLLSNLALQYGAARLPANVTAVVMLVEVVFASVSAVLLGSAVLGGATLLGGALILAAAALSWLEPQSGH
ncbi:DMT family transporter [Caldimonas tepidiphila]|uniref:DMT family transporter n=1 Tax=Caldimonas tepidiphila TaxID=2315841 RepID=UPI000E5B1C70|nr:DMT family transporter [Caldimonas tepidiphila]